LTSSRAPVQEVSSADLLSRELFISSPLAEPNLVLQLPRGVGMSGILAAYDHRAFRLPCAECGAARHYKGYLVELSDGRRTLLGNRCGAKVFGNDWAVHHRQFRRLIDRQALLRRGADLLERLPALGRQAVEWSAVLDQSLEAFGAFEERFPAVTNALRMAVEKSDGWLEEDVSIAPVDGLPRAARVERRRLGRIAGRDAFRIRTLHRQVTRGVGNLLEAQKILTLPNLDDRTLERAVRGCGEAIEALLQAASVHNAVLEFLSTRNVRLIETWALCRPGFGAECLDGRLAREHVERQSAFAPSGPPKVKQKGKLRPQQRFRAQELMNKARKDGSVNDLPRTHPKLFTLVAPPRRPIVNYIRHVLTPPDVTGIAPLDQTIMERLTNARPAPADGQADTSVETGSRTPEIRAR